MSPTDDKKMPKTLIFKDFADEKIRVGQQVILDVLNEGKYSGEILFISKDRNRIQLKNIIFRQNNISGEKQFYRSEIRSIEILDTVENDTQKQQKNVEDNVSRQSVKFEITDKEFGLIKPMIENCVYITHKNQEFEDAITDISKQDFVGLVAEGVQNRRNGKLTFLGISTPSRVYVMNVTTLTLNIPLRLMLVSKKQTKVMHDASLLSDYLYHCHGVQLSGVFDTMISHMALGYSKIRTTLRQCVTEHMILPPDFMGVFDCNQESTDELVKYCSSTVAILLSFHEFLTEKLLKNAYASFDKNLNYSRYSDIITVGIQYNSPSENRKKLNEIEKFKLNISPEFQFNNNEEDNNK